MILQGDVVGLIISHSPEEIECCRRWDPIYPFNSGDHAVSCDLFTDLLARDNSKRHDYFWCLQQRVKYFEVVFHQHTNNNLLHPQGAYILEKKGGKCQSGTLYHQNGQNVGLITYCTGDWLAKFGCVPAYRYLKLKLSLWCWTTLYTGFEWKFGQGGLQVLSKLSRGNTMVSGFQGLLPKKMGGGLYSYSPLPNIHTLCR